MIGIVMIVIAMIDAIATTEMTEVAETIDIHDGEFLKGTLTNSNSGCLLQQEVILSFSTTS